MGATPPVSLFPAGSIAAQPARGMVGGYGTSLIWGGESMLSEIDGQDEQDGLSECLPIQDYECDWR